MGCRYLTAIGIVDSESDFCGALHHPNLEMYCSDAVRYENEEDN